MVVKQPRSTTETLRHRPRRPDRHLSVVVFLAATSTLGFAGTVRGWGFLTSSALGAAGAGLLALAARERRWLTGEAIAVSVLGFAALGGIAAAGVPSSSGYTTFLVGLVDGWSTMLSSTAPADLTPEFRVLPYALSWGGVLIGSEILRRGRHSILAIIGPLTTLALTTLITVEHVGLGKVQGMAYLAGTMVLAQVGSTSTARRRSSMVGSIGIVVLLAPIIGPNLPLMEGRDRFDLRRFQDRPWNPLDLPSPLVTLKASLKDGRSDDVVFVVTSAEPIQRWTLAVLGDYNGVVWSVADETRSASASFEPVDTTFPDAPSDIASNPAVSYRLDFAEASGPWVPIAGWPMAVEPTTGPGLDLRLNRATGTLASPTGIEQGEALIVRSMPRPELSNREIQSARLVSNDLDAELDLVPPHVRNVAGDLFEGVDAGTDRALALSNTFLQQGFYDDSERVRPGHSLARLDEFLEEPDRFVGYAEQYAAAAGVLARVGGVPTRVVVGYVIPAERYENEVAEVKADDIAAWIEIQTVEHGWIPVTVSPDRTREPQQDQVGITIKDVVVPNPPPPPPPPPDIGQTTSRIDDTDAPDDDEDVQPAPSLLRSVPAPVVVAATAVTVPGTLIGALATTVMVTKARRRRRRRAGVTPEARINGAWQELLDRCSEAGLPTRPSTTPMETVRAFAETDPTAAALRSELEAVAEEVDRAAFHRHQPTAERADGVWSICDHTIDELWSTRSRWQRACMHTDPRSLLPPTRLRPRPHRTTDAPRRS